MSDRLEYIDALGLSPVLTSRTLRAAYVEALGLSGALLETEEERLQVLARLRAGAGVTVYTGPTGAPFWSLASLEVKVRVEPDGLEAPVGETDERVWALRSAGLPATEARRMASSYDDAKPPTKNHSRRGEWDRADALRSRLALAAAATASVGPIIVTQFHTEPVLEPDAQLRLLDAIDERVSLDYEWRRSDLVSTGLSVSTADRTWYLPRQAADFALPEEHADAVWDRALALMKRQPSIWHNVKADFGTQAVGDPLDLHGATQPVDDTLIMLYLLGDTNLKLKEATRARLGRDPLDYPGDLEDLPLALGTRYAGADTRNTFDLYELLAPELEATGQGKVYADLERPLVPVVASMERYGTPVAPAEVARLRDALWAEEQEIRGRYQDLSGFDIADDEGFRDYCESRLGWRPGSVAKGALAKVRDDWMTDLLNFRRVRHQRRAFIEKHLERWENAGCPEEMWAYTNFNQAGGSLAGDPRGFVAAPRTGRFSSSSDRKNPLRPGFGNLQNQPRGQRTLFIPPPCPQHGYEGHDGHRVCCDLMPMFWSFDYSGLELHIAAARSRDPLMLGTLAEVCPEPDEEGSCRHRPKHGDLHDAFLYRIIDLTGLNVGRPVAKQGNFEQLYEGGADKLVQILAIERAFISYETAKLVVDAHHTAFAGYHGYGAGVIEEARLNGGSSYTIDGRMRNEAEGLFGDDPERRGWAERALVNMTIQGTAADILKRAMNWMVPLLRRYGAHLSLQVHDEICGWVPAGVAEEFRVATTALLAAVPLPGLKLKVEGGYGYSWAEVH